MQTMEAPSTEKRIDDLNVRITEGFNLLHEDIRELRGDIKDLRSETSERFDAMHRTMMRGFFALGGIMVTLFLALAGLQGL
jgi:enhancing lycopene biosynthesis protein 2